MGSEMCIRDRLNVESVDACADGPVMDIMVCKSGSSGPTGVPS